MQEDLKKIKDAGLQVVGVSYDSVDVLKRFANQAKLEFPLLSDPKSETIDAFGLRNKEAGGQADGVPHPATIVIGRDGIVKAKLPGETRTRHSTAALLEAANALKD